MNSILAYIGPETIMPLTTILAAIGGAIMLFGRTLLGLFTRAFRRQSSSAEHDES